MSLKIGRFLEVGTVRGEPLNASDKRLVPVARTVSVTLRPFGAYAVGFAWTRPVAVEVTDAAGWRRVPIPDIGLRIMLALALVGAAMLLGRARWRANHSYSEQRRI